MNFDADDGLHLTEDDLDEIARLVNRTFNVRTVDDGKSVTIKSGEFEYTYELSVADFTANRSRVLREVTQRLWQAMANHLKEALNPHESAIVIPADGAFGFDPVRDAEYVAAELNGVCTVRVKGPDNRDLLVQFRHWGYRYHMSVAEALADRLPLLDEIVEGVRLAIADAEDLGEFDGEDDEHTGDSDAIS